MNMLVSNEHTHHTTPALQNDIKRTRCEINGIVYKIRETKGVPVPLPKRSHKIEIKPRI